MKKFIVCLIIFWISFFALIFLMGATRHVLLNGSKIKGVNREIILFLSSMVSNIANFSDISKPMEISSNFVLGNGFSYNKNYKKNKDYLLVSSWNDTMNQSIVKLIQNFNQKTIFKWNPDIELLIDSTYSPMIYSNMKRPSKYTFRLGHPSITSDGSLIFGTFEFGGLARIDKNSNLIWSNKTHCHHSIEQDFEGNFWICSYNSSTENSEKFQIMDDAIKKVSAINGKVIYEKSVFEILMENGYERGRFFTNPSISTSLKYLDYIHLNEVQPVLEDSRFWKKGDLFLSLRHQNMVLLYRPSTNKIIWFRQGPWIRQHCVTIIDSTRIGIFGNNVIDAQFDNPTDQLIDGHNVQYIYDFSTNTLSTPYEQFFKSSNIGTYTQGRSRILPDGEIFVEETNHGRILYGNYKEEIWSYIERIDKDHVSMFSWSRYITEEEFKKFTFLDQKTE